MDVAFRGQWCWEDNPAAVFGMDAACSSHYCKGGEACGWEPDTIEPALNREENVVLDSLLRVGTDVTLELSATLSMDQGLGMKIKKNPSIETGICLKGSNGYIQDRELTKPMFSRVSF